MNDSNLVWTIAAWLIPLVVAIVFHEVAHGYVARAFGDHTAERLGRLTLNPIRHVDPVGTLLVPIMLAVVHAPIFGWAKPVPVDGRNLRNPRRDMIFVALAGPGTNFVLAAIGAIAVALAGGLSPDAPVDGVSGFLIANLRNFLLINIFLAIFNLIPLPPFDGGHVVQGLLPRAAAVQYAKLARFGFPIMLILLVVLPSIAPGADIVGRVIGPIAAWVLGGYLGFAGLFA